MAVQLTWDTVVLQQPDTNTIDNLHETNIITPTTPITVKTAPIKTQPVKKSRAKAGPRKTQTNELIAQFLTLPRIEDVDEYDSLHSTTYYSTTGENTSNITDPLSFDPGSTANIELWDQVLSIAPENSTELQDIRHKVLTEYKSLGQTVKITGDRGLADMARRREANYAQFFTPREITSFIASALDLDTTTENPWVMDNSCGIGRMFEYLSPTCKKIGIEKEEQAYHMATRIFPDAHIIHDSLENHPTAKADVYIINPPFSIQINKKNLGLDNAGWGELGPGTSIQSHIAAMEIAITNSSFVAAVVPIGYFKNESTYAFEEKWVPNHARLMLRIDMPAEVWKESGTAWPCSIIIYTARFSQYDENPETFHRTIHSLSELSNVLTEWKSTEHFTKVQSQLDHIRYLHYNYELPQVKNISTTTQYIQPKINMPLIGDNTARIVLAPDATRVNVKSSDLLTALKVEQRLIGLGSSWNDGLKEYTRNSSVLLRRNNIIFEEKYDLNTLKTQLENAGINTSIDPQVNNWIHKKRNWLKRQQIPHEQVIRTDDGWKSLHAGQLELMAAEVYKERTLRLNRLGLDDILWDFQKEDAINMCMKDSNILAWEMGLGKTRQIITMALMYGCKHNLIIVEPKLKTEFIKEFKYFNITNDAYQVIETPADLKNLKKFNLVAYNKLWKPLHKHTKKTFAKAMRRRFQFIAVDEAHKMKAKDSKQAAAVRMLKARYKLLSTGTPIANYPRNIFSLLVWGFGDATERNPYGYYNPIETGDDFGRGNYTSGTRRFREDFVTIEYYTPQFEQTLDSGRKSREVPKIANIELWWEMMAPKIIRRQRDEPKVAEVIKIPEPIINTELIDMSPTQIDHYKKWLDKFAEWFKEQLRLEKKGDHTIDQMVVLAHLTQLQFASTIPQSKKTNNDHIQWSGGLTTKQLRVIQLVKEAINNEEKIIVFSERPDFQIMMQKELKKYDIKSHVFIGSQGINTRTHNLDDFRNNGTNVLLATTTCGETGLNIPEASQVIIADTSWTPSKQVQAYSRILRPQQEKTPVITLLRARGTIDEYMQQLMTAKDDAIKEAIDYQETEEIDMENWMTYRDFTIKMLREEGYDI